MFRMFRMWEEMVGGFPPPQCLALPHQQRVREILSLYPPRKETPIRVLQKGKQGKQGKQFNADRHFSEVATETKGKQTRNSGALAPCQPRRLSPKVWATRLLHAKTLVATGYFKAGQRRAAPRQPCVKPLSSLGFLIRRP